MNEDDQTSTTFPATADSFIELRQISSLRIHPACASRGLHSLPIPETLKALDRSELISVSSSGIVMKGLDLFTELSAKPDGKVKVLVHPIDDLQALEWIIRQSAPKSGYSGYARFLLTKDLFDESMRQLGRENMRLGGKYKGLSNLENLTEIRRNEEFARKAVIGVTYVGYASKLEMEASDEVKRALLTGELPIYRAYAFLKDSRPQKKCLDEFRVEQTQSRYIRQAVRGLCRQEKGPWGMNADRLCEAILRMSPEQRERIRVATTRAEGELMTISIGLMDALYQTGDLFDGR
jgi:hypothetical protein